jgi:hypothetical protein
MITRRVLASLSAWIVFLAALVVLSPSVTAASPGPEPISPQSGDTVDKTRDMKFEVAPAPGASQ